VQKLNNLESQAWLYEGILERLGEDPSVDHERIARTLEALEYKRSEILQELKPRRPRSYRVLAGIQDFARVLLASQAEKDYEQLQKIVTNLVLFTRTRQSSQIILSEVINKLAAEIAQNKNQISPYRLRLAYRIDELMKVLSAKIVLGSDAFKTDISYQSLVNELRSRVNLLSREFNSLLRAKQEDTNELNRRIQEISGLTKSISDLHRDISNRDADIVILRKSIQTYTEHSQEKQAQVNSLQSLIYELQRDVQDSNNFNQIKEDQINQLQSQLSDLNQQKINFKRRIQDISAYARIKESEVENLQNDKSQLNSQKSDLQRQYQTLYEHYQKQKNEIANLNKQLEDVSKINRVQSQKPTHTTPQPFVKPVSTKAKISEEEYQRISNKSEYEHVSGYPNSRSGKWVDAYYRRRKKKKH
jgi:chromosome segregation ATPase